MKYKIEERYSGTTFIVRQNEDGSESWIPTDPANSDYQAYLRWLNGEEENGTISQEYGETLQGWRSTARAGR